MGRKRKAEGMPYKRVALGIIAHEYSFGREKIKGIIDFYQKHSAWDIHRNEMSQPFVALQDLAGWDGDGVICEVYSDDDVESLYSLSMPCVNTSSRTRVLNVPSVCMDNVAIGGIGAEHLVACKLDHFAFIGPMEFHHVSERYEGFVQTLDKAGAVCMQINYEPRAPGRMHIPEELMSPAVLMDHLAKLELPVGIMASSDRVGFSVLDACRKMGLRSPEDVALIGVDNDEMYCNLAYSSMTSIDPNAREIGFTAASVLNQMMNGELPESSRILIPPKRIFLRNSTDMMRSEYPEVARALRYIRNHANEFIDVTTVLDVVPVSRRWLEIKFKEEVGHGIYQEIRRVHIERAKELLETTDWAISRVSRESGFSSVERFEFAFRKVTEMSTLEYRKQR